MKTRISQLYMTEADQLKWANEILNAGELVVFAPSTLHPYPRFKVGDGKRTLKDLEFFIDTTIDSFLKQLPNETVVDGGRITDYSK